MQLLRKIAFYLFLAVYLIGCPLTILYALGYLFRPGSEQGLVKSGLVYLSTTPPGASIYVNKRRYTKKTPAVLQELVPGAYPIRLILKGYQPWERTVPVEAEKSTVLERILLLPNRLEGTARLLGPFRELVSIPRSDVFLLASGPTMGEMILYDVSEDQPKPLLPPGAPFRDARVISTTVVEGSPAALLRVATGQGERFLWIELKGKALQVEDITDLLLERPLRVEWDGKDKRHLFALHNGNVNRVDLLSKAVYPKFLERVRGFGLMNRSLYVLQESHLLWRADTEGKSQGEPLLSDPVLGRFLFGEKGFFTIRPFSKDLLLFLGDKGELLSNRLPYRLVERGVLGLELYPERERVLLWRKDRLGILDFSERQREEGVFEQGPTLLWVYKDGRNITQASWIYEGSHILFRDEDQVFLLELETYGPPQLHALVRSKRKSPVFYSEASGTLFYLDAATSALRAIELLPRKELAPLSFPVRREDRRKGEIQAQ